MGQQRPRHGMNGMRRTGCEWKSGGHEYRRQGPELGTGPRDGSGRDGSSPWGAVASVLASLRQSIPPWKRSQAVNRAGQGQIQRASGMASGNNAFRPSFNGVNNAATQHTAARRPSRVTPAPWVAGRVRCGRWGHRSGGARPAWVVGTSAESEAECPWRGLAGHSASRAEAPVRGIAGSRVQGGMAQPGQGLGGMQAAQGMAALRRRRRWGG